MYNKSRSVDARLNFLKTLFGIVRKSNFSLGPRWFLRRVFELCRRTRNHLSARKSHSTLDKTSWTIIWNENFGLRLNDRILASILCIHISFYGSLGFAHSKSQLLFAKQHAYMLLWHFHTINWKLDYSIKTSLLLQQFDESPETLDPSTILSW